jgi:hypothetical protein
MERPTRVRKRDRRAGKCGAALLAAGFWLGLLIVVGVPQTAQAARQAPGLQVAPPTNTPIGPPAPTDTPLPKPTATVGAAPSATTAPRRRTPTPPPAGNGGGGNNGGGTGGSPDSSGPQPTKVVLAQPTVGVDGNSGDQGFTSSVFGSNGLLIATSLSCIVALLGLVTAGIAISVLVQKGYGPFLRGLWYGKRTPRRKGAANDELGGIPGRNGVRGSGARSGARGGAGALWRDEQSASRSPSPRRDGGYGSGPGRRGGSSSSRAPQPSRQAPRGDQRWR